MKDDKVFFDDRECGNTGAPLKMDSEKFQKLEDELQQKVQELRRTRPGLFKRKKPAVTSACK